MSDLKGVKELLESKNNYLNNQLEEIKKQREAEE